MPITIMTVWGAQSCVTRPPITARRRKRFYSVEPKFAFLLLTYLFYRNLVGFHCGGAVHLRLWVGIRSGWREDIPPS